MSAHDPARAAMRQRLAAHHYPPDQAAAIRAMLASCPVCYGAGMVADGTDDQGRWPLVTCPHCGGAGTDPES